MADWDSGALKTPSIVDEIPCSVFRVYCSVLNVPRSVFVSVLIIPTFQAWCSTVNVVSTIESGGVTNLE